MRVISVWILLLWTLVSPLYAAEIRFDFGLTPAGQTPPDFRSALTGKGKAGDWRILMDEVPPALAPLTTQAPVVTRRAVLAQLSEDLTDEHFPLLIYEKETFRDFEFTARFKTVRGAVEQMAGLAFRIQNETNYYVVRASVLGNTFRFYKVVDGQRGEVIGPEIKIPSGVWNEMTVRCKGNEIRCLLNGEEAIPALQDNTFQTGKIGFWTKSDSVTYFLDAKVVYTPREAPAQALVRQTLEQYNKLLGVQIYVRGKDQQTTQLIASGKPEEIGKPGGAPEADVLQRGVKYYGKEKGRVLVTLPLRDKNGEPIAAVKLIMTTFAGQTEKNALERSMPILQSMQHRVTTRDDLIEE